MTKQRFHTLYGMSIKDIEGLKGEMVASLNWDIVRVGERLWTGMDTVAAYGEWQAEEQDARTALAANAAQMGV